MPVMTPPLPRYKALRSNQLPLPQERNVINGRPPINSHESSGRDLYIDMVVNTFILKSNEITHKRWKR